MGENVTEALAQLRVGFLSQLRDMMAEIRRGSALIGTGQWSAEQHDKLCQSVEQLLGSVNLLGLPRASEAAHGVERALFMLETQSQATAEHMERALKELERVLRTEVDEVATRAKISEIPKQAGWEPLICMVSNDPDQAGYLSHALQNNGYRVHVFTTPADFRTEYAPDSAERPAAVIVDMAFPEGEKAGADLIAELALGKQSDIPVVMTCVRDDLEARLAAFRAGVSRYLVKPVEASRLVNLLNALTGRQPIQPYRVVIVDDDPLSLEVQAEILREAGMSVCAMSEPMQLLERVDEFNPDVVLLDLYMPDASGPELAAVLRERDAQLQLPILFLSGETDLTQQLLALNLGGDDFLVKPVQPDRMVAAVEAWARRSRQSHAIQQRLETSLYEREREHLALDHHAIVSITDPQGNITYVNDRFCEISGYNRGELLGRNHSVIKSGLHTAEFYAEMWETISRGEVWQGEVCNRRRDGRLYWVESTITPFLDSDGKPYQYVSIRTDITHVKVAEAALRQSEERLRRGQVYANIGTWEWNIQSGALFWSERIAPLFGYAHGELQTSYENFLSAIHPDDRQKVTDAVNACVEQDAPYEIEHRVVWPDGTVRWLLERGAVERDARGRALQMLGVVQDIDDRKRAELALAERERQLREAQTLARIGNWTADMVQGTLYWSDEIYSIFGYKPGSFAPSTEAFYAAVHPDDLARVRESEKRAIETGRHDVVHRIVRPDGTVRYVHELAQADIDETGTLLRLTGTVQDITERTEMQQQMAQQEKLLDMLHHATTDFVEKGNFFETMDEMLATLLELTGSEYGFMGEVFYDEAGAPYLKTHAITNIAWSPESRALYEQTEKAGMEFRNLDTLLGRVMIERKSVVRKLSPMGTAMESVPSGHPSIRTFLGVPIFYGEELVGMYGIANRSSGYDAVLQEFLRPFDTTYGILIHSKRITELEAYNRNALIDAKESAERANQAKSEFLSSMSHELRTPMNAILGFGQLMEYDDALTEEHKDNVREILKAGNHLLELINEVLDLAKVESGQIDLSLEPMEVDPVIEECVSLVGALANKRGIHLRYIGLENGMVRADRTRFKQALLNLLSNAIKYNREGGSVVVKAEPMEERLRISVTDTGIGIPEERLSELFQPFHRLDAEYSNIEGSGIGLTITRRIVEMMGGSVDVESSVDTGSTFWMDLPLESMFSSEDELALAARGHEKMHEGRATQHLVLYIEDNPANLRLVAQILGQRKHIHLLTAHTSALGVELALARCPELILLDINMPGMDGYQMLELFRSEPFLQDVPIIAVTANAMPSDIAQGLRAGFSDYLTKPLDVDKFLQSIDRHLLDHTESEV